MLYYFLLRSLWKKIKHSKIKYYSLFFQKLFDGIFGAILKTRLLASMVEFTLKFCAENEWNQTENGSFEGNQRRK